MARLNNNYDTSIDYFAVLGVHYGACEKTVKMMYRKMARRYHPDVSTIHDAQKKFQEIALAYEVLKKHRDTYCYDFERKSAAKTTFKNKTKKRPKSSKTGQTTHEEPEKKSASQPQSNAQSNRAYRTHRPIDGKDRVITYPLTLRYAIRLLKLGSFYIPGLKVKMKFTREAFKGKTFRLEGKGYSGLFGGKSGDYLVRFNIKLDSVKFQLEEGDIYGVFSVPKILIKANKQLELEAPSGRLSFKIPRGYGSNDFIKVPQMGLPSDGVEKAGDFFVRLVVT